MRARSPVKVPSRLQPSSTYWTWAREWGRATRSSLRVSVQVTGRPSRRATAVATEYSGARPALPPKPPPTWGAMTRTAPSSRPKSWVTIGAMRWGIWVEA